MSKLFTHRRIEFCIIAGTCARFCKLSNARQVCQSLLLKIPTEGSFAFLRISLVMWEIIGLTLLYEACYTFWSTVRWCFQEETHFEKSWAGDPYEYCTFHWLNFGLWRNACVSERRFDSWSIFVCLKFLLALRALHLLLSFGKSIQAPYSHVIVVDAVMEIRSHCQQCSKWLIKL